MVAHRILTDLAQAEWRDVDPGASGTFNITKTCAIPLVSAAAESRTLADPPKAGIWLLLYMKTDGGDITITASTAYTQAGNTTLVFSDAGDMALLQSIESGSNFVWRLVGIDGATGPAVEVSVDLNGQEMFLDADSDSSLTADTDDQLDIKLGGTDVASFFGVPAADSGASNSILDIAFTTPVDTTGTNNHAAITIDMAIGNATGGTNVARGIYIEGITGDAEVTEIAIQVDSGWQEGLRVEDDVPIAFGDGGDAQIDWSTADTTPHHALVLALGDNSQTLHITDAGARGTDWQFATQTHPTLVIHSNTTPTTDYLSLGGHTGATAIIDAAGATGMSLRTAGTGRVIVTDEGAVLNTIRITHGSTAGTKVLTFSEGTAPVGTITTAGSFYAASATNTEINWIDSAGNSQQLSTT